MSDDHDAWQRMIDRYYPDGRLPEPPTVPSYAKLTKAPALVDGPLEPVAGPVDVHISASGNVTTRGSMPGWTRRFGSDGHDPGDEDRGERSSRWRSDERL